MSSFENKVSATYDFLRNRASWERLTNHQEVGAVIGELLHKRGQRSISTPVRREKVKKILAEVDRRSWEADQLLLSSVVVHFWDNEPGGELRKRLNHYGVSLMEAQEALFDSFDGPVSCEVTPETQAEDIPDDVSELVADRGGLTEDRIRSIIREELRAHSDF